MSPEEPWDEADEAMAPRHTCGDPARDNLPGTGCPACEVADADDAEEEYTGRRRR